MMETSSCCLFLGRVKQYAPSPTLNCFICESPEKPAQKLAQATPEGYPTLAEAVANATILKSEKEEWKSETPLKSWNLWAFTIEY